MDVSVLLCVYNVESFISDCILSVLRQTYKDFEIIVLNDGSTDDTEKIIKKFNDKRIKYFKNKKNIGIPKSRNMCIRLSHKRSRYLFFTDGDCIVKNNWISQGLTSLKNNKCDGVEGRVYYFSEKYKPTFYEDIIQNKKPGWYMTSNMAYKKNILKKINLFNEKYDRYSDRELALRILNINGKIFYNPNMIVYHQRIKTNRKKLIKQAERIKYRVHIFKKYKDKGAEGRSMFFRIVYPLHFIQFIFPPLVLSDFFLRRYEKRDDLKWFFDNYSKIVYERLYLWRESINEKIFLI